MIGGGAAGMSAASRVRRLRGDFEVVVFEETSFVSHAPCGVPYYVEGLFTDVNLLMQYTPQYFRESRGIEVRTNVKVTEVGQGYVKFEGGKLDWDYLVIATGARPKLPKIPIEGDRVFTVHHPAEAQALKSSLESPRSIGIVGSGYVGIEMAEALRARGKDVTIMEMLPYPLYRALDEDTGRLLMDKMSESGIKLRFNERVLSIERDAGGGQVVITDAGKYRFDAVILAVGVEPNTDLAKELGLRIGETGAIWVDDHMRTSVENVYAAGDSTETINLVTHKPYYHPFGPTANKMGYVAGTNIAGGDMRFPGVVGTSFTKFMDLQVGSTGLTARDAVKFGFKPVTTLVKSRSRARYYPGGRDIWVKLIVDETNMRIIGAQVLGYEEVLGRVNVLSLAIARGLTVEELFFTDLAYLPAVTTVWDPLVVAARQFLK